MSLCVGSIGLFGKEIIAENDDPKCGMGGADFREQAFGRVEFAILFGAAIVVMNRFEGERQDLRDAGTNQDGGQDLMMMGCDTVVMFFIKTMRAS